MRKSRKVQLARLPPVFPRKSVVSSSTRGRFWAYEAVNPRFSPEKQGLDALNNYGSGKKMNTIPPNDFSFYEMLNEVVQEQPATSLDPELMGPLAAIGIIKGKPFKPYARQKKILTEALALANATSRSLLMNPRESDWYYYPGSAWLNPLFVTGYEFETPIPQITRKGMVKLS